MRLVIAATILLALFSTARADRGFDPYAAGTAKPIAKKKTLWGGLAREVRRAATVVSGRPAGCPVRAWCGCFLSKDTGLHRRDLWLARNWARVGSPTHARVGAIVVWRHHVGRITAVDGHRIRVLSGNDGGAVRDRWRSVRGAIAFRML